MEFITALAKGLFVAVFAIVAILGFIFVFSIISGFFVWILWNWLMPDLFGLKEIGYLQAMGLTILCNVLFKSSSSSKKDEKK